MPKRPNSDGIADPQIACPRPIKDVIAEELALKVQPETMCLKNKQEKYTAINELLKGII
jgi:hypothetical protein